MPHDPLEGLEMTVFRNAGRRRRCVTLLINEAARQASPDYVPFLLRKKTPVWVRLWRALVRLIRGVI